MTLFSLLMSKLPLLWVIFASVITVLVVVVVAIPKLFHIAQSLFYQWFCPIPQFKSYGRWAVVTGSTDGIGRAYARELARRGMDIILLSRSLSKLQNVAAEIEKEFKVMTRVIDVDFTRTDIYERIRQELDGMDIGVLVNNVGMSYPFPEFFAEVPDGDKKFMDLITCNNVSMMMMTRIVLPAMAEKKKGIIINLSSLSGLCPVPLLNVYASTKAFVESFSRGLASEYKRKGIIVHLVTPGYVATNMSGIRTASWVVPTPEKFVRSDLRCVLHLTHTGGYWFHNLLVEGIRFLNYCVPSSALWIMWFQLAPIRAKALRKQKEKQK